MAKGYWMVQVEISDPKTYDDYRAVVAPPLALYGGRFLVRAGNQIVKEGTAKSRPVLVEFPSYQAAQDCYDSPEYQDVLKLRLASAQADFVIAEGWE
ncbi:DUF1330 domain-containing protein [Pseudorhodobacter sp. W20_MBD10_FR17]|uniref:DUF1330 domain-containing protein n=1 Tax=Pseudorhodobacter sp. W20_MBD10_FR17 TaxID=3240266 RepID=UPI003F95C7D6